MLVLAVRLRFGVYDAASSFDPRRSEWPPEPARVFCALVAGDPDGDEWAALRWLERQGPPEVHHPQCLDESAHSQFLITNDSKAGSPLRPGRTAAVRVKPAAYPADEHFAVVWPAAHAEPPVLDALRQLARRVPYVGRSTSQAAVDVLTDWETPTGWEVVEPADLETFEIDLGVPYLGYSDELSDAFESGRRAWEARRTVPYRRRLPPVAAEPERVVVPPSFRLMVFEPDGGIGHVSHTTALTANLRSALMDRVDDPLPAILSGHGADDRSHVAFLALPNVTPPATLPAAADDERVRGHNPHGDGRILALALAIPADVEADDIKRILAAVDPKWDLELPDGLRSKERSKVELTRQRTRSGTWGANPERWIGPSKVWATATPVVFDQFPNGRSEEAMVSEAVVNAGYPQPVRVVAQRAPMLVGAASHAPSSVLRRAGVRGKPFCHAWIEFADEVTGPVLAGSMRYRGLGLFAPIRLHRREEVTSDDADVR